ncbi:hypothetical protein [Spirosoma koreense]
MMFPLNPTIRRDDRLTDDEFYDFCQANPSLRIEREADGQIVFEKPTNTKTGLKNADLIAELVIWNRRNGGWWPIRVQALHGPSRLRTAIK